MDKKVKGVFFVDYIRMIRSRKDVNWHDYLLPTDLRFIHQKVLDGEWYPFETFERMGLGILKEIANDDMEVVKLWGRISLEEICRQHENIVCAQDPVESLIRFQVMRQGFFNFDPVNIITLFKNYARVEIKYGMSDRAEEAATMQAIGYLERLLELSGANNVLHNFLSKSWEGRKSTVLELNWSNVRPEMKVIGSLFLDYVKMVKSRKDVDWPDYLLPRDMPFLAAQIQPREWYPLETFERMGIGILKEIAKGDLDAVRRFGQTEVEALVKVYPDLICQTDPRETLMRFQVLRKSFFNFDAGSIDAILGKYARLKVEYSMSRPAEEAACLQGIGFLEKLLEKAGAKKVEYKFSGKSWDGYPTTMVELKWK